MLGFGGCSPAQPVDLDGATVVDVRTAAEFASGHLDGALNIDFQDADFASQIAQLPKDGVYYLYCRSGSRAGQAASVMKSQGFANVTNLGGLDAAASATGLNVVQ